MLRKLLLRWINKMREIIMSDTDDTDFLKLIDDLSGSKEINCKNRIRKRLY